MKQAPPRLARQILRWFVNAEFVEEIEGDLDEVFYEHLSKEGLLKARLLYFVNVLRAIRPYHPRRKSRWLAHEIVHGIFLKLAFRNLRKRRAFSAITFVGLSIGLLSFLFIMEYVAFERSYDTFHVHGDKIYRVAFNWGEIDYKGENSSIYASSVPAMGPALTNELPEVAAFTRFVPVLTVKRYCVFNHFQHGKLRYSANADRGFYADSAFLKIFSFPIIAGQAAPLVEPRCIAITRSYAQQIFGHVDADKIIGSLVQVDAQGKEEHRITAILEDVPANSHIQFDYLISYCTINSSRLDGNLGWSQFYTYILANHPLSLESIHPKLEGLVDKLYGKDSRISIFIQPLKEIYLNSSLREEVGPTGSSQQLIFLSILAYAILFMGWINYVNMFLARSMERVNEIGVKKVLGSTNVHLAVQFFAESVILNLLCFALCAFLLILLQLPFENWVGKPVSEVMVTEIPFLTTVMLSVLAGSVAAGLYPSIVLASHAPTSILGKKFEASKRGVFLKQGLVYFQFMVSFVMVTSAMVINKQVNFMTSADLGMELSGCVALRTPGSLDSIYSSRLKAYEERLLTFPYIKSITASSSIPGKQITMSGGVQRVVGPELDGNNVLLLGVDENFLETYDIKLIAGKNFPSHTKAIPLVILNEAAVKTLMFESPREAINHRIHWQGKEFEVIGVFANYNHLFLKETFEPIMLSFRPATQGYITLKIEPGYNDPALAVAKREMQSLFPSAPFEFEFLESTYDYQYHGIRQFESLAKYLAGLAIVIACIGLFALSYYSVQRRILEIAVRKVFGARTADVLVLLSKKYVVVAMVSCLIGTVVTLYVMNEWLQNFAFAITLSVFDFLFPSLAMIGIVVVTVGYNCLKTSLNNPSKSLKHH
jgi:putative ABC transport system permease protein